MYPILCCLTVMAATTEKKNSVATCYTFQYYIKISPFFGGGFRILKREMLSTKTLIMCVIPQSYDYSLVQDSRNPPVNQMSKVFISLVE